MKIVILLGLILLFAFRTWQSTGCASFNSFHINPLTVKIAVDSQRLIDNKPNSLTSKFFHNKITTGIFENSKNLTGVINPVLITSILAPLGIFMVLASLLNFHKIKSPLFKLHLTYVLVSTFLLAIINPKIGMYNFMFSLYSFTFWSVNLIHKRKILSALFLILLILSFWYYSLDWQMKPVCNEIFFN